MNARELAETLAGQAETVCRRYLPNGRKEGRYWVCGNIQGDPGKSLMVRIAPPGTPGKWNDYATSEHGDLLDLIKSAIKASDVRDAMLEARRFLALPLVPPSPHQDHTVSANRDTIRSARYIWRQCGPATDTHADAYLRRRGILYCDYPTLRFHPALNNRQNNVLRRFPALVAAAVDNAGRLTGIHRTWLHPTDPKKAAIAEPRKALGRMHHNAVRFGRPRPGGVLVAGEGIETVLSIVTALPAVAAAATLSAAHLAAFHPPDDLDLLIVARDSDDDGTAAALRLRTRARQLGIDTIVVAPQLGDFNDDLLKLGPEAIIATLAPLVAGVETGNPQPS